jgi:hypothetical protein
MNFSATIGKFLLKKVAVLLLISATTVVAFGSLGDGKSKSKKASLLNNKPVQASGKFSLRSGYQYRGSQIMNQQKANNVITLSSLVTYQKGNTTFILPIKTTVNTQKIKLSLGIPQLNKN